MSQYFCIFIISDRFSPQLRPTLNLREAESLGTKEEQKRHRYGFAKTPANNNCNVCTYNYTIMTFLYCIFITIAGCRELRQTRGERYPQGTQ